MKPETEGEKMKRKNNKMKNIICVTSGLLLSPVVAAGIVRGIDGIGEAVSVFSEMKVGTETGLNEYYFKPMLSHGYGWTEEKYAEDVQVKEGKSEILPYPEISDVHSGRVISQTFGNYSGSQYFSLDRGGQVRNCTDHSEDILLSQSRKKPEFTVTLGGNPQVLIMHTHTTESFEPFEREFYDSSFSYRTSDEGMNVTAVGDAMKKEIEKYGINVIHDKTIHDYPSYTGSYDRSSETVKKILRENPEIKVVLDIHRDAIASENDLIAPVTEISGRKAAQIMIVSGCDDGTMNMPDYLQNFRLACLFQQQIESDCPGLTRPVLFDYRNYNQELTSGSLLIEVGSHGNTIDQVKYSGELIGNSIGKSLQSLS